MPSMPIPNCILRRRFADGPLLGLPSRGTISSEAAARNRVTALPVTTAQASPRWRSIPQTRPNIPAALYHE